MPEAPFVVVVVKSAAAAKSYKKTTDISIILRLHAHHTRPTITDTHLQHTLTMHTVHRQTHVGGGAAFRLYHIENTHHIKLLLLPLLLLLLLLQEGRRGCLDHQVRVVLLELDDVVDAEDVVLLQEGVGGDLHHVLEEPPDQAVHPH